MRSTRSATLLIALFATAAVGTASCTNLRHNASPDAPSSSAAADAAVLATKSEASELRAALTYLLMEHTYLVGIATRTVVKHPGNLENAEVAGALAELDANSIVLARSMTANASAAGEFLTSWRQQIRFIVDYASARATGAAAKQVRSVKDLNAFRTGFGLLLSRFVPELPADAVAEAFKPVITSLLAMIDAQIDDAPAQFTLLATSASHAQGNAAVFAQAIVLNRRLKGSPSDAAAELRAQLTGLFVTHAYDVAISAINLMRTRGSLTAPETAQAIAALDSNSVSLAQTLGQLYPTLADPFLEAWRQLNGDFLDYTAARTLGDGVRLTTARNALESGTERIGQLVSSAVSMLPARKISDELKPFVVDVNMAIDGLAAHTPTAYRSLGASAKDMTSIAAVLAAGIAANKKLS